MQLYNHTDAGGGLTDEHYVNSFPSYSFQMYETVDHGRHGLNPTSEKSYMWVISRLAALRGNRNVREFARCQGCG